MQTQGTVKDIALAQAKYLLQIQRGEGVKGQHRAAKVGRKLVHNLKDTVDKGLFELWMGPVSFLIGPGSSEVLSNRREA
jgi:hypothetical protein